MRTDYLMLARATAIAIFAATAAAADDGAPTVDTASPPFEGSGGSGTSTGEASQTEVLANAGAAQSYDELLLDSKLAGILFEQNAANYYQTNANSYSAALRKGLSCARWGVVAMKLDPTKAALRDESPVSLFKNGVLDAGACGWLQSSGVGATAAHPGTPYAVWVVCFFRRFSTPPTWTTTEARDVVVRAALDCLGGNTGVMRDLNDVGELSVCIRDNMSRAVDYLLVASQLKPFMATNIPPRTTMWVETVPIADYLRGNHVITIVLQP